MFSYLNKNFNVSRETYEKLEIYKDLLFRWQNAVNLVSRGTLDDFWNRHIVDSLQIADLMAGRKILDIGSGAGFPGMVLAICGDFDVTCLDSDSKKCLFLEEVARLTETSVDIQNTRIDNLEVNDYETVTSRGFSRLVNLLKYTKKHSSLDGHGVFLKGARIRHEIEEAQREYEFDFLILDSKTDKTGKIVLVWV